MFSNRRTSVVYKAEENDYEPLPLRAELPPFDFACSQEGLDALSRLADSSSDNIRADGNVQFDRCHSRGQEGAWIPPLIVTSTPPHRQQHSSRSRSRSFHIQKRPRISPVPYTPNKQATAATKALNTASLGSQGPPNEQSNAFHVEIGYHASCKTFANTYIRQIQGQENIEDRKEQSAVAQAASVEMEPENANEESHCSDRRNPNVLMWKTRMDELHSFLQLYGHCSVPHNYDESPQLVQWVKRQRYQYKLKVEGKRSTLTDEREAELSALGFVWNSHAAKWEEKFLELVRYKAKHGHCNVPITSEDHPKLAIWVKSQRRHYLLQRRGCKASMTSDRIARLEGLGFVWLPRGAA